MTEPLTPAQLAKLVVEVHPHLELMARAAPHMKAIESAAPILDKWPAIQADLNEALKAPEHLRPAFTKGLLDDLARKHGITPELMGALALEMKGAAAAPSQEKRVAHSPKREGAIHLLTQIQKSIERTGLSNTELIPRLEELAFPIKAQVLSGLRTGRLMRVMEEGGTPPMRAERLELILMALELILGEQKRSAA